MKTNFDKPDATKGIKAQKNEFKLTQGAISQFMSRHYIVLLVKSGTSTRLKRG